MNNTSFSIVVATKGRVKLLVELIESVAAARKNYSGDCEFIIVDDSDSDERKEIELACEKYDCKYFYHKNTVSAKRNYGVDKASNEVILFLDSDCIATENILDEYAKKYSDPEVAAVAGPLTFVGEDTWFWRAIEATPYLTCFYLPKFVENLEWGVTANFSVRRDVFMEVGGFDSNFKKPAGEDVDLGLMIREAGYKICGSAQAEVYHSKKTWIPFKAMWRRLKFYGAADCDLTMKHPNFSEIVLPKRCLMYAIYILIFAALSFIVSPWMLIGIPGIIILENFIMSIMINTYSNEKKATLSQQMMAQLLIHRSDSSYIIQCIKRGYFKGIRRQMIYYLGQYKGMLTIGSMNTFVMYGILMAALFITGVAIL